MNHGSHTSARFLVVALAAVVAAGACVNDSTNPFPTTAATTASDTASAESAATSSGTSGAADSAPPTSVLRFDGGGLSDPEAIVMAPSLPQQPAGVPIGDQAFGFTLQRVSNLSDTGGFESHIYSQLQAFSADGHYLLLTGSEGYVVRRTVDFTILTGLNTVEWNVSRWHPTMPHTVVHFDTNADSDVTLELTDVETLDTSQVMTLPDVYRAIANDQSFDELSEDGRLLAGMVVTDSGEPVMFSLDVAQATLGTVIPISELYAGACQPDPEWGQMEPDWIGVSPLGTYMMVQWVRDGPRAAAVSRSSICRPGSSLPRRTTGTSTATWAWTTTAPSSS